jgi:formylmethanofuran dehydrogenase subunit B
MICPHCGKAIDQAAIAAHLGASGGAITAKRGSEYFRQLQKRRKRCGRKPKDHKLEGK